MDEGKVYNCGCVVFGSAQFCHMHAAAPELLKACKALVEQFHAYENGWLGEGVWRIRIGLPMALADADAAIRKAEGE